MMRGNIRKRDKDYYKINIKIYINKKGGCGGKKGIVGSNDMVYVMRQRGAGQAVTHHTTPHPVDFINILFISMERNS